MKYAISLILMVFILNTGLSQACGLYIVKYIGELQVDSVEVKSIKLPSIQYLHGLLNMSDENAFIEINCNKNQIDFTLKSPLTSFLYDEPKRYLELYKSKRNTIPIIITMIFENEEKEMKIEIEWTDVLVSKVNHNDLGDVIIVDLQEIELP